MEITNPERVMYRGTNYGVRLTKPLPPNEQLNLEIDWNYEIPDERQVKETSKDIILNLSGQDLCDFVGHFHFHIFYRRVNLFSHKKYHSVFCEL